MLHTPAPGQTQAKTDKKSMSSSARPHSEPLRPTTSLDYPAAVFPVTTVDPTKDIKNTNYVPKNDQDKFVYDMYSPEKYKDAPVSLQIVGRRQYDEKVLAALKEIEHAMGRN